LSDKTEMGSSGEKSSRGDDVPGELTVPPVDPGRVSEVEVERERNRGRLALALVGIAGAVVLLAGAQAAIGDWRDVNSWFDYVFPWLTGAIGGATGYYFGKRSAT
jgi:hypothetical protein